MTTTTRPITFAALHDAKRAGTLVAWLSEMSSAERVEAAQVCAANSARSVADWLRTFGELMEAAEGAAWVEQQAPFKCPDCGYSERVYINGAFRCLICGADITRAVQADAASTCHTCGSDGSPCVDCNPVKRAAPKLITDGRRTLCLVHERADGSASYAPSRGRTVVGFDAWAMDLLRAGRSVERHTTAPGKAVSVTTYRPVATKAVA